MLGISIIVHSCLTCPSNGRYVRVLSGFRAIQTDPNFFSMNAELYGND
jgi:hypothetical protein